MTSPGDKSRGNNPLHRSLGQPSLSASVVKRSQSLAAAPCYRSHAAKNVAHRSLPFNFVPSRSLNPSSVPGRCPDNWPSPDPALRNAQEPSPCPGRMNQPLPLPPDEGEKRHTKFVLQAHRKPPLQPGFRPIPHPIPGADPGLICLSRR